MSKTIEAKVELDKTRDAMLALGLEYGAASLPELISTRSNSDPDSSSVRR